MRIVLVKIMYLLVKDSSLFTLPYLNRVRNLIFQKYLGSSNINIGARVSLASAHYSPNNSVVIGSGFRVGQDSKVDFTGGFKCGENVTISEGVKIFTHDHEIDGKHKDWRKNGITKSSLEIQKFAWLGANCVINNSVRVIGEGAIVAAGAVVTKDVEAYSVVAGVPATIIRYRNLSEK